MPEQNKHYNFFQNKECEYFPCHKGVKEEDFNCLFCYCPLYTLGKHCGRPLHLHGIRHQKLPALYFSAPEEEL